MKVKKKLSKEFQIKLRKQAVPWDQAARDRVLELLESIEVEKRFGLEVVSQGCGPKERRGERYDTLPDIGLFRRQGISLASEKTGSGSEARTKLKCKLHSLVPELLYPKPNKAWCWPALPGEGNERGYKPKFKLEQDIHFNNTKFCATGYLTLPGHDHEFARVEDFLPYFPRLEGLDGVRPDRLLVRVKDWDEVVFDDMEFCIGKLELKGALVSRYRHDSGEWDETEFAFKLKRKQNRDDDCDKFLRPAAGWRYRDLRRLAALYKELFSISSVFIQSPSIFYFSDPVASRDIRLS